MGHGSGSEDRGGMVMIISRVLIFASLLFVTACHPPVCPDPLPPVVVKPPPPPVRTRPDLRAKKMPHALPESEKVKGLIMDLEDVIGYSELLETDLKAYR